MGDINLGEFELLVLLASLRLGEAEAYAVSIGDEITVRTGRSLQRAAVYVTLQRLEKKGLIATRLGDPRPERARPRTLRHERNAPSRYSSRPERRYHLGIFSAAAPDASRHDARQPAGPSGETDPCG